jgi:hypothetical protein
VNQSPVSGWIAADLLLNLRKSLIEVSELVVLNHHEFAGTLSIECEQVMTKRLESHIDVIDKPEELPFQISVDLCFFGIVFRIGHAAKLLKNAKLRN